jgi:serine/threonine-protein kinase
MNSDGALQVMHLDVKPQNVLVDSNLDLKLVDFGFAAAFMPDKPYIRLGRHGRGTPMFCPPEMVRF